MVVMARQAVVVLIWIVLAISAGGAGDVRTMERATELLAAPDARGPHGRLVATLIGRMSDSELAEMTVVSPNLTLRLRAAEELALHRGDVHPCESFAELLQAALDVPLPPRFEKAVRNGKLQDRRLLPELIHRPATEEIQTPEWTVALDKPGSLTVLAGSHRSVVDAPRGGLSMVAASDDKAIACALFEFDFASEPLCVVFSRASGQEIWRRRARGGASRQSGNLLSHHDMELVVHDERAYLFGLCTPTVYIECYSLTDGALVGLYRGQIEPSGGDR